MPNIFLRKRFLFVNATVESAVEEKSAGNAVPTGFQELRDFISYIKQYNRYGTNQYDQKVELKSKKLIRVSSQSNSKTTQNEGGNNRSLFQNFVVKKLIKKNAEEVKPKKIRTLSLFQASISLRKSNYEKSVVLSKIPEETHKSFLLSNISRKSQYKIGHYRISKYILADDVDKNNKTPKNRETPETKCSGAKSEQIDQVLEEIYGSGSICVSFAPKKLPKVKSRFLEL